MNNQDLAFIPALTQADLIRKKEITPLDLVTTYLDRIVDLDDRLGSYFYVARETAIAEAKQKTEFLATLSNSDISNLPAFFGVPIAIKDLIAVGAV